MTTETEMVEEEAHEEESEETVETLPEEKDDNAGLLSALKKERAAVKELKKQLKEFQALQETEAEAKIRIAREETEKKYKKVIIESQAKNQLLEAGVKDPNRFIKMIDMDSVDVTDDGEVIGIKEQILNLKKDFPEIFNKPTSPKLDAGEKKVVDSDKKLSSAEKLALRFNEQ